MTTIEERLDALESRQAITDLVSGYAQGFDRQDRDLLRSLWTEDGVLDLGPEFGEPFVGVPAIMDAAETLWAKTPHMHHWMANSLITIHGDAGRAESALDCFVIDSVDGPTQVGGLYADDVVRIDGTWKIKHRKLELHYWSPLPDWKAVQGTDIS